MLVTREMDYAVRIIRALRKKGSASVSAIVDQENLSPAVTYKILGTLMKAGIVGSRRGPDGGYFLKKSCRSLTFYDLFQALGAELFLTKCADPGYLCGNNPDGCCAPHREFCRIQSVLEKELKRTPLDDLFHQQDLSEAKNSTDENH